MTKLFFDHIVDIADVHKTLDLYVIEAEERTELEQLIDEILHHHVLNIILSRLPTNHHPEFISMIKSKPHDTEIWVFLKTHAGEAIEDEVKQVSTKVKDDIKKEIHKAKTKR